VIFLPEIFLPLTQAAEMASMADVDEGEKKKVVAFEEVGVEGEVAGPEVETLTTLVGG